MTQTMVFSPPVAPPTLTLSALTDSTPWQTVVAAYLDAEVDSANTRRAYQRHIRIAFEWLSVDSLAELNGAMLAAYRASFVESHSPASASQALAAVRAF